MALIVVVVGTHGSDQERAKQMPRVNGSRIGQYEDGKGLK